MPESFPLIFDEPVWLTAALAIAALTIAIALRRKLGLALISAVLLIAGTILLALAAGHPAWRHSSGGQIAVIVDVSPSTRGAAYRDEGELRRRIAQLIGGRAFAITKTDGSHAIDPGPQADAILLFSDGRTPVGKSMPPTYCVIDRALDAPGDAAVQQLEWRGRQLAATVANQGAARSLAWSGAPGIGPTTIPAAASLIVTAPEGNPSTAAQLSAGDRWPENDTLNIAPPPSVELAQWWIDRNRGDIDGFRTMQPNALPGTAGEYLGTSLVVLNNIPSGALNDAQQRALLQYVRDLGGGLLIIGGDDAFGAGGYTGTALDTLSPLASHPPTPSTHWVLLVDSSGSMATAFERGTRWDYASDALLQTIRHLPPDDSLSVGNFAESVRWWTTSGTVRDASGLVAPADVKPQGPTNLDQALRALALRAHQTLRTQVILLTDGEARINDAEPLAALLKSRKITLNLVLTGDTLAADPLDALVTGTGGQTSHESDPRRWQDAARTLAQSAGSDGWAMQSVDVRFLDALRALPSRTVRGWNRTWIKAQASSLASASRGDETLMLGARWAVGSGMVIASAFELDDREIVAFADLAEQKARDPRFSVSWHSGPELRVTLDAADGEQFINGLSPVLSLAASENPAEKARLHGLQQVAPGRYETAFASPRLPAIATVSVDGRIVARRALAGRYPPEFDAIGNDPRALNALAARTGGEVIEPGRTRAIDLPLPQRRLSLTAWCAASAAAFLCAGLILRKS